MSSKHYDVRVASREAGFRNFIPPQCKLDISLVHLVERRKGKRAIGLQGAKQPFRVGKLASISSSVVTCKFYIFCFKSTINPSVGTHYSWQLGELLAPYLFPR